MKKHLMQSIYVLFAFILIISINSCKKDKPILETDVANKSLDLITEAKQYFDKSIEEAPIDIDLFGNKEKNKFQLLGKKVLWDYAKVKKASMGEAIRIPILYDKETYIKAGKDKKAMSLYNLSYLMMYKDKKNKMHTEWVITIPDDDYVDRKRNSGVKFTGLIYVLDWHGNLIKSYKFTKEGKIFQAKNLTFDNSNITTDDNSTIKTYNYREQCTIYKWYTCSGTVDDPRRDGCRFDYSTTTCEWVYIETPQSPDGENPNGGGDPNDYPPEDTDCANTTINCDEVIIIREIIKNLNNTEAECILNRLLQNQQFNELVSEFQNKENQLNLEFKMGNPVNLAGNPVSGQTHHDPGTLNFSITINTTIFNQVLGIEAAKTFVHEAFHANLWLEAETWYPTDLPSNFRDMSLVEQFTYIEQRSGNGFIESNQHNYMASHINHIANAMQEYTRIHYPPIFNNPETTFASYTAMAYRGLEGTQCFTNYINSLPNGIDSHTNAYAKLVVGAENKCP